MYDVMLWRAAVSSHRLRNPLSQNRLSLITLSSQYRVLYASIQYRTQSIGNHPLNENSLESVFESIEQQVMEDERQRAINKPTPWFNLLHYPSRAAWRASDHLLGNKANNDEVRSSGNGNKSPLEQTQFNIIRRSERTNKQLRRTYKRIVDTHKLLAVKRERQRRMAANFAGPLSSQKTEQQTPVDGFIEDDVGRWHKNLKSNAANPTYYGCDDPSVLLLLSMGMSKTPNDSNLAKFSKLASTNMKEISVGYGPEQTLSNVRYRFGPQYAIARRVLLEVQSLLGGTPVDENAKKGTFQPKKILDFGSGVGSASAAALEVFGVKRSGSADNPTFNNEGIEWIHSIDASQSMREAAEKVLTSVLQGVPWEDEEQKHVDNTIEEEIASSERILRQIKGDVDERGLERRRKRQAKWEQSWSKQTNYRTRLTFGQSIADCSSLFSNKLDRGDRPSLPWQRELDEQRRQASQEKAQTSQQGSFDLILCNYTLSEMSNVESSLTAAALLWEKLAPNGVMVFVEPGTPDGFSSLRSIRSMLLECCPPRAMKERCKKTKQHVSDVEEMIADGDWQDECHIIAPCTHNDTCPMSRHQRKHIKRNTRFGKFETAESLDEKANNDDISAQNILGGGSGVAIAALGDSQSEKEAALRELLGEGEDISEEDLQSMLDVIESMGEGAESTDEVEEEEEEEEEEFEDDGDFYDIDETLISSGPSTTDQTNVFDTSFCSFVHNFPGGTSRKRGEKFSYLVVQKRVSDSSDQVDAQQGEISLKQVDVVDLLSQSVYHAQRHKEEYLKERLSRDDGIVESSYHEDSSLQILQQAVDLEDEYLDSADDSLGLELLHGERRRGWGRLIRAPLKRKGHVLLDYCSAGGCSKKCGQIIRQKVSRGWSARVAPGCYSAARKARWGGLWPDLNGRINEVKRKELMKRQDES